MSFNFILLFSITVFVASIMPGPSMLLPLTHGMQYGAKRTKTSAMRDVWIVFIGNNNGCSIPQWLQI